MSDSLILAVEEIIIKKERKNSDANSREKFKKNNLGTVKPSRREKPQGRKEKPVIKLHMTNILRYVARCKICPVILFVYMRKKNEVGGPDNLFHRVQLN